MEIKKNNQNLKTNIYLDDFKVDTRIIPLFRTPITLKKIQLLKKFKDNKSIEIQKKLTVRIKPINQKLRKYSYSLLNYKNNIYNIILNNINIKNNNINMSKYLFLNNNDKSKLKINLKKVLWSSHMRDNINYSSEIIQILKAAYGGINKKDKISNLHFLYNLTKFNRNIKNLNNRNFNFFNKILKKSRFPRIGLNKFYASLYYSPKAFINSSQTLPLLKYKRIKLELSSLPNNINKDWKFLINKNIKNLTPFYYIHNNNSGNNYLIKNINNYNIISKSDNFNNISNKISKILHNNFILYNKRLFKLDLLSSDLKQINNMPSTYIDNKKINLNNSISFSPFSIWLRKLSFSYKNLYIPYIISNFSSINNINININYNKNNINNDLSFYLLNLLSALRLIQNSTCLYKISPKKSLIKGHLLRQNKINLKLKLNKNYQVKKINLMLNGFAEENNFKKIIEIRNLLLIIKNMQNHIEYLINFRKELILKRRIKLIKKILSPKASEDIELEKNNLKKNIKFFNKSKDNYLIFPAPNTDSFYNNELLVFKKDIELMLANSFDLFVYIKDDLSFDRQSLISNRYNNASDINNLPSLFNNASSKEDSSPSLISLEKDNKKLLSLEKDNKKLYLKYLSLPFKKSNISFITPAAAEGDVLKSKTDKKEQELNIDSNINKFKESNINSIYVNGDKKSKVKAMDMFNYFLINKQVLEENKKKMVETIRSMILKHKIFDSPNALSTVSAGGLNNGLAAPVNIIFSSKNNKPIISHYLKSMSIFNMIKKGTFIYFSNSIGYFFKKKNLKKFKNIYKFLFYFFKTMYCLISKPVFVFKTDKIIIQLFYFVITPNFFKDKILRKNEHYKKLLNKFKQRKIKRKPFKYWINNRIRKRIWKFNKLKLKIRIALKKASNISLIKLYPNKFNILCNVLSKAFNKNIELNLIRLHYPYKNSNILANLLALLINKIKFRRITRKLFKFAVIKNLKNITASGDNKSNYLPAYLTGMNIKIAGRLMNYNIIPRKTVQKIQKGSSSFGKVNYTDFARYTSKNRRGAFSITVSSGQNFF